MQKSIDHHRHDAIRILDFPHAAEYVSKIAKAVWGEEGKEKERWLSAQLHALKHQGPEPVLTILRAEIAKQPQNPELVGAMAYLEKREHHNA